MPSPSVLALTALLTAAMLMGALQGPETGWGAYYSEVDLRAVCRYRVEQGWNPELNCAWPCLAAWGRHEPEMLGEYVLAHLPGAGYRV